MAKLSLECKKLMVQEISTRLNSADTLIVTNYKGLTSQDLNELRRNLRNISAQYIVVNNAMAKRALVEGLNNRIAELMNGEVGIAVDRKEDPTGISKVLMKFSKSHEVLKIYGGIMKGRELTREDIAALAALPSREILLGRLANVLNGPVQGLASVLNSIICGLVYALNALKEKRKA